MIPASFTSWIVCLLLHFLMRIQFKGTNVFSFLFSVSDCDCMWSPDCFCLSFSLSSWSVSSTNVCPWRCMCFRFWSPDSSKLFWEEESEWNSICETKRKSLLECLSLDIYSTTCVFHSVFPLLLLYVCFFVNQSSSLRFPLSVCLSVVFLSLSPSPSDREQSTLDSLHESGYSSGSSR